MSNFLALASATAALRHLLQDSVSRDVDGARVTTVRPDSLEGAVQDPSVNIYLYQVSPNAAWRNDDLPTRRSDGELVQRPRAALDLHYLLTFYGNEEQLEPQRLLGSVVRTLHGQPLLTRPNIEQAISTMDVLAQSDLAAEVELVKLTPIAFSLEELSKLWSVFFQTPYTLSIAYQGTVVFIEGDVPKSRALPVLKRMVTAWPLERPLIERVTSVAGPGEPITADTRLVISGRRLRGEPTQVFVDDFLIEGIAPADLRDTSITIDVPTVLRAGVHGVQVVHQLPLGDPPTPHAGIESNTTAFVLRPKLLPGASGAYADQHLQSDAESRFAGTITVLNLRPPLGAGQQAVLLMNGIDRGDLSYRFPVAPDQQERQSIVVPVSGLEGGRYLLRVQVGRAESPVELEATTDPQGRRVERFAHPSVEIV